MPELIDKKRTEAKVFLIARFFIDRPDQEVELVKAVIHRCCEEIDKQPTIEPEVRHGEWVETEPDEDDRKIGIEFSIKCSRCHDENSHLDFNENHEITGKTFLKSRFCPTCGARMDADEIAERRASADDYAEY